MPENARYSVSLEFEDISFPPFKDILIITNKSEYGKQGVLLALDSLVLREEFELLDIDDEVVTGVLIAKRLLLRMPKAKIFEILR